jgi:cell division protein FtsL
VEAERIAAERAKAEDERRQIDAERARLAAEEAARQAKIRAEQEARERIEQERLAEERRKVEEAELAKRREALRPDVEKVHAFSATLKKIEPPKVKSAVAKRAIEVAMQHIADAAAHLGDFSPE